MKRIILISSLLALSTVAGCEKEEATSGPKKTSGASKTADDKNKKDDAKDPVAVNDPAAAADSKGEPDAPADSGDAPPDAADASEASSLADTLAALDPELMGYDPRVAQAATVAKGIEAQPEDADTVLAAAKLDREGLDALMYEIASDPDLTSQYRIARGI